MQEKAVFMNIADISTINSNEYSREAKLIKSHQTISMRHRKLSLAARFSDKSSLSLSENNLKVTNNYDKIPEININTSEFTPKLISHINSKIRAKCSIDSKHDSRLVNEVFQVGN